MGAEEDKKFDAVMAGFLNRALGDSAAQIHCPPADLLAAYHERSLTPDEMIRWKEHIAACSLCQEVLALLEATENISLLAGQENEVPVLLAAASARPAVQAAPDTTVQESSSRRRKSPSFYWRALAPLGAMAAGFLIWMAVRETNLRTRPVEIAENRPPAAPAGSPEAQVPASREEVDKIQAELKPAEPSANGMAKTQTGVETDAKRSNEKKETTDARSASGAAGEQRGKLASPSAIPMIGTLRQRNQAAPLVGGPAAAQMKAIPPPPPPAPPGLTPAPSKSPETAQTTNSAEAFAIDAAAGSAEAERKDSLAKQKTARAGFPLQAESAPAKVLPLQGRVLSAIARAGTIRAPGSRAVWSVGVGGQILHSVDGGKTWDVQPSGVTTALLAGAAPSESVCWIVGDGGFVLRTTDGGAHWLRVSSPPSSDLTGVTATDADHAVLWTRSPVLRYATNDGGKTWFPADK